MSSKYLRDFAEELNKAGFASDKFTKQIKNLKSETDRSGISFYDYAQNLKSAGHNSEKAVKFLKALEEAFDGTGKSATEIKDEINNFFNSISNNEKSLKDFIKELKDAESSLTKFGHGLNRAGSKVGNLGSSIAGAVKITENMAKVYESSRQTILKWENSVYLASRRLDAQGVSLGKSSSNVKNLEQVIQSLSRTTHLSEQEIFDLFSSATKGFEGFLSSNNINGLERMVEEIANLGLTAEESSDMLGKLLSIGQKFPALRFGIDSKATEGLAQLLGAAGKLSPQELDVLYTIKGGEGNNEGREGAILVQETKKLTDNGRLRTDLAKADNLIFKSMLSAQQEMANWMHTEAPTFAQTELIAEGISAMSGALSGLGKASGLAGDAASLIGGVLTYLGLKKVAAGGTGKVVAGTAGRGILGGALSLGKRAAVGAASMKSYASGALSLGKRAAVGAASMNPYMRGAILAGTVATTGYSAYKYMTAAPSTPKLSKEEIANLEKQKSLILVSKSYKKVAEVNQEKSEEIKNLIEKIISTGSSFEESQKQIEILGKSADNLAKKYSEAKTPEQIQKEKTEKASREISNVFTKNLKVSKGGQINYENIKNSLGELSPESFNRIDLITREIKAQWDLFNQSAMVSNETLSTIADYSTNITGDAEAAAIALAGQAENYQTISDAAKDLSRYWGEIINEKEKALAQDIASGKLNEDQIKDQELYIEMLKKGQQIYIAEAGKNDAQAFAKGLEAGTAEIKRQIQLQETQVSLAQAIRDVNTEARMGIGQSYIDMQRVIETLREQVELRYKERDVLLAESAKYKAEGEEKKAIEARRQADQKHIEALNTEKQLLSESRAIREGYLDAMKQLTLGVGGFAKITPTQGFGNQAFAATPSLGMAFSNEFVAGSSRYTSGGFKLGDTINNYQRQYNRMSPNIVGGLPAYAMTNALTEGAGAGVIKDLSFGSSGVFGGDPNRIAQSSRLNQAMGTSGSNLGGDIGNLNLNGTLTIELKIPALDTTQTIVKGIQEVFSRPKNSKPTIPSAATLS